MKILNELKVLKFWLPAVELICIEIAPPLGAAGFT
jgi:hypothetical protein